MTQLRQKMLEEIQRRNYSHRTARTYVRIVRDFAEYFHQSPDKLGPEQIRQYQAHLFQAKKLAPATVSQYVSALRFLFVKTLRRHFLAEYIPFPKSSLLAAVRFHPYPTSVNHLHFIVTLRLAQLLPTRLANPSNPPLPRTNRESPMQNP